MTKARIIDFPSSEMAEGIIVSLGHQFKLLDEMPRSQLANAQLISEDDQVMTGYEALMHLSLFFKMLAKDVRRAEMGGKNGTA